MKVTLRKFLEITGTILVKTYFTSLYVDEYDELFEEWYPNLKIAEITDISELEPYMDYEIYAFRQFIFYEIIDTQNIYLRKM